VQIGFVISILLHVAILAWTLFTFQSQRQLFAPTPEPVAVGMITPNEANKVRQGTPTAKQPEAEAKESPKGEVAKKEAPKARPVAAAPPPPPPPEPPAPKVEQKRDDLIAKKLAEAPAPPAPPPPTPPPEVKKTPDAAPPEKLKADEQRAADALRQAEEARKVEEEKRAAEQKQAEEQKRAEERKRLEEQRRQAELKRMEDEKKRREAASKKKREEEKKRLEAEATAKSKFDADRIAALLNKVPDTSAPPPSAPPNEPTKAKGPALGAPDGRDKQLSASEVAMLEATIGTTLKPCLLSPSGGGGTDLPPVTLRWRLRPDGSLDGEPMVVEASRRDLKFQLVAEAAIRAVRGCAPFQLPPDKYHVWKTITWVFDPALW
jgi:colicin import membrane protein